MLELLEKNFKVYCSVHNVVCWTKSYQFIESCWRHSLFQENYVSSFRLKVHSFDFLSTNRLWLQTSTSRRKWRNYSQRMTSKRKEHVLWTQMIFWGIFGCAAEVCTNLLPSRWDIPHHRRKSNRVLHRVLIEFPPHCIATTLARQILRTCDHLNLHSCIFCRLLKTFNEAGIHFAWWTERKDMIFIVLTVVYLRTWEFASVE